MRARQGIALLLGLLAGAGSMAYAAAGDPPTRFRIEAELRPKAVSACGRFALEASARFTPEARSADGRFALKAVSAPAVGCDPFPDPIFANGFETP